ncbi:PE family protein [Gordonia soli]|uniref:PE domain-containing protein n=1 Tax=Gordonia soli NBRC 108243 TaxID=1223545 RepID=M0QPH8_9ACTN|nr:PE family protein [Gordonia soli]GAC69337.1 hypothetical protein GS4_23_01340 [Gordonia soli NBRC 108243]
MSENQLSVEPGELRSSAAKLDALAHRLETTLANQSHNLTVTASGTDEVSVRAADSFNAVAGDFTADGGQAAQELRKIAAVLRLQAANYGRAEDSNTETFLA